MTRPIAKPWATRRRPPIPVAICKLCRLGILEGQPRVWLTDPMGLSHEECAK